jgi:hypothetical protein
MNTNENVLESNILVERKNWKEEIVEPNKSIYMKPCVFIPFIFHLVPKAIKEY